MASFHHGISAQEVTQGILPMRNANVSVLGLIVTSTDADDTMYPVSTPVLLTGITQDNIDKAGTDGTLRDCLQTIRDIHNPTVVVLRVSQSFEADSLDILLTCPARFGLMPKRFGAPELDTPDVVLKLVSIAKRRRGIVYASPRKPDGTLITDKAAIVAYRDTYGDRELCIIDGEWGVPGKPQPSDGSGGSSDGTVNFMKMDRNANLNTDSGLYVNAGIVYSVNGGPITSYVESLDGSISSGTGYAGISFFSTENPTPAFMFYGKDALPENPVSPMPSVLDGSKDYYLGINEESLAAYSVVAGYPPLPTTSKISSITYYPASKLPSSDIDFDVFQLIIDPDSYTTPEKEYFAAQGVKPIIKNTDGSYTIQSEMILDIPSGV